MEIPLNAIAFRGMARRIGVKKGGDGISFSPE